MNMKKKREKFINLANKRVNKALKQINLIGNLSNKNNYEYTQDEVKQMIKALEEGIQRCKESFNTNKEKNFFQIKQ